VRWRSENASTWKNIPVARGTDSLSPIADQLDFGFNARYDPGLPVTLRVIGGQEKKNQVTHHPSLKLEVKSETLCNPGVTRSCAHVIAIPLGFDRSGTSDILMRRTQMGLPAFV